MIFFAFKPLDWNSAGNGAKEKREGSDGKPEKGPEEENRRGRTNAMTGSLARPAY